MAMDVILSFNC